MELFSLKNKNAVVIGGAGGIGQSIAQGLAEAGARVLIASRNEESLKKTVEEIKTKDIDIDYSVVDATDAVSYTHLDVYKRQNENENRNSTGILFRTPPNGWGNMGNETQIRGHGNIVFCLLYTSQWYPIPPIRRV